MTTKYTVTMFHERRKTRFVVKGAELSKVPYMERFRLAHDPKNSEANLSPIGRKVLEQIRACKTDKTIETISIGATNIVIRFVIKNGNPHKSKSQTMKAICAAIKSCERSDESAPMADRQTSSFLPLSSGVAS